MEARLSIELLHDLTRKKRKGHGKFSDQVSREDALRMREELISLLEGFKQRADADLAASLRPIFESVIGEYLEAKRQLGRVDFVDLLVMVRDLVRDYPDVREHLNSRFTHIFVDEFQDTDPLQVEIMFLLAASNTEESDWRKVQISGGQLFIVGDPKQSIYRFRRADVQLYEEVKKILTESGVRLLHLQTNFRSVQPLQKAINACFEVVFDGDTKRVQPHYVPLRSPQDADNVTLISGVRKGSSGGGRPARPGTPDLVRPNHSQVGSSPPFRTQRPHLSAGFSPSSRGRCRIQRTRACRIPIEARHITFLFRRFISLHRDMTRPYIRALDARGITHLLVGSRTFHQREEVESLRAALTAIEWPDDELNVFATLRGSLFAIEDGPLLAFRKKVGNLHPFHQQQESIPADCGEIACHSPVAGRAAPHTGIAGPSSTPSTEFWNSAGPMPGWLSDQPENRSWPTCKGSATWHGAMS